MAQYKWQVPGGPVQVTATDNADKIAEIEAALAGKQQIDGVWQVTEPPLRQDEIMESV